MELTLAQMALIGFIASVLTQAIKLICMWLKKEPNRTVITLVAFVVSVALAYIWMRPTLVPSGDPMQLVSDLLNQTGAVLGTATFIYNELLDKLLSKIGLSREAFAERMGLSPN